MTAAIVVAAGAGSRLGGNIPKSLRPLGGKPLLLYSLFTLEACPAVDGVVVVAPSNHVESVRQLLQAHNVTKVVAVVAGGDERHDSVRAGLDACPAETEWVAVHDAARPFATSELFSTVIAAARQHGAAIAAIPTGDTLKRCVGERIAETVSRDGIWRAQTPQVFRRTELTAALARAKTEGVHVTDDAEAMERDGRPAVVVSADERNFKITTPEDWHRAEYLIATGLST